MNATEKKLYLTFDDGPVPSVTPWVLDILKQSNTKATFFCVGENIQRYPEIFARIINEQHQVGNHTHNHLNGWNTDTNRYLENIEKCAQVAPSGLFRPPYGRMKPTQSKRIANLYTTVMWDVLSGDYDKETEPGKCLQNVIDAARNGSIIVFHDNIKAFRNLEYTLPRFIDYAKVKGFEFDTLRAIL
jgi:peptidoglycan/xylan/chitin deacetylase (PgdA/CDA1 family)